MQGALVGSATRVAGGIGIVACAAVVALTVGGGGVFGGLGGIFGSGGASLQIARQDSKAAAIVAAPSLARRSAHASRTAAAVHQRAMGPGQGSAPRARTHAPPRRSNPAPTAPTPVPAPVPAVPAPPPPAPSPSGGTVVTTLGQTVKQVTAQAPPQVQPLTKQVDSTIDTIVRTCTGLPICP